MKWKCKWYIIEVLFAHCRKLINLWWWWWRRQQHRRWWQQRIWKCIFKWLNKWIIRWKDIICNVQKLAWSMPKKNWNQKNYTLSTTYCRQKCIVLYILYVSKIEWRVVNDLVPKGIYRFIPNTLQSTCYRMRLLKCARRLSVSKQQQQQP